MRKHYWLRLAILKLVITFLISCNTKDKIENKKPNILFVMSDDHTWQAIGAYKSILSDLNPSPNIDALAKEGMVFDNCYVTNAICTPSRASIMTGQYNQVNKIYDLHCRLPVKKQYLAKEMNNLGYQTAVVGKWHLHEPPEEFNYYSVLHGQGNYFDPILYEKNETDSATRIHYRKKQTLPGKKYKGHSSDVITNKTLEWLKNHRNKDKPFFLMHHFKAPHDDFENAPRYNSYLEDVKIPEPKSLYKRGTGSEATRGINDSLIHYIGTSVSKRHHRRNQGKTLGVDQSLKGNAYTSASYQLYLKKYLRCVKGVDDNLKRIVDYLKEEGLYDNTIIVYTGDQGFFLGEQDYIDKRWIYDPSMRMPFIVRYPKKIKPGSRSDAMINNTYFAPTLIELAGGKVPEYMQGKSFKTILETGLEPEEFPQHTYYRYWMHMHHHEVPAHFGIRTKEYKLIFFYGRPYKSYPKEKEIENGHTPVAWELYDLKKDPDEMVNQYKNPEYAPVVKSLKNKLKEVRKEIREDDTQYEEIQKVIEEYWDK
ncbi:putative sulfatase [Maribacter vaceletii]|uniref:Putative sulfatase n=1 Tax=Maribacter vaceletii TaxID=1206816 RepID=A0A495EC78_9FLAO|nr:sulfatase [Maribacter vaceletii]RKR14426.1 putative sulfatase [Maribacter vaceletii]